jgi:GH43 family beta-xylosidase
MSYAASQIALPALRTLRLARAENGLEAAGAVVVWKKPNSLQLCQIHWGVEKERRKKGERGEQPTTITKG